MSEADMIAVLDACVAAGDAEWVESPPTDDPEEVAWRGRYPGGLGSDRVGPPLADPAERSE